MGKENVEKYIVIIWQEVEKKGIEFVLTKSTEVIRRNLGKYYFDFSRGFTQGSMMIGRWARAIVFGNVENFLSYFFSKIRSQFYFTSPI